MPSYKVEDIPNGLQCPVLTNTYWATNSFEELLEPTIKSFLSKEYSCWLTVAGSYYKVKDVLGVLLKDLDLALSTTQL